MPSPIDRKIRRSAVALFIVGSILIVGLRLVPSQEGGSTFLRNFPQFLADLFDGLGSCASLALALAMAILTYRCRKDRALNWVSGSFGAFFFFEMVNNELAAGTFRIHQLWLVSVLDILSVIAALLTVLGLPNAIRRIQMTIFEAARSRESELKLSAAAESSTDSILMLESIRSLSGEIADFRITFVNDKGAILFGKDRKAMLGVALYDTFPLLRNSRRIATYQQVVATGDSATFECAHPVFKHGGEEARLYVRVVKLGDGIVMTVTDVTNWHKANRELKKALAFSTAMVACSPYCTIITDPVGMITSVNPAGEMMLGYRAAELIGKEVAMLHEPGEIAQRAIELSSQFGRQIEAGYEVFCTMPQMGITDTREWTYIRKDGSRFPGHLSLTALKDESGETIALMGTSFDLTERKLADEYIYHVAHHDTLTGLPTRGLMCDRLSVAMERSTRSGDSVAVMMVDMDNFKRVNDSLGHKAGDDLLSEIAKRLKDCVRKSDTVARMGGDEFVVLLTDMSTPEGVEVVARKIQEALSNPVRLGRHDITVTASIGVSVFPESDDIDKLLKNADLAMYRVKARGRNGVEIYNPALGMECLQRLQMESALRNAIHAAELEIVFQPQISFADNRMIGVEALLRWHSAEFGNVPPTTFIPIAEETGLIVPISEWVLRLACKQIAALQQELGKDISLAVNVSPRQFQQKNFPTTIEMALRDSGLRAEQLELEITEQLLMIDSEESLEIMKRVRRIGVQFAIDDFGTGFSNMGYITRFAVDRIKIDRSFITKCDSDSNSRAVTAAIIALAHSLDIEVIAEGVETTQHVDMLTQMKCDQAQGYLFSRPLSLSALKSFAAASVVAPRIPQDRSGVRRAFADLVATQV